MNHLPGDPSIPPGVRMADIDPAERRRDDEDREDPRTEWNDWWALWCVRREREESQRGRDDDL